MVVGAVAALALFDVLPELPGWAHLVLPAGFAIGLGTAPYLGVRGLRLPDANDARRRPGRDSGLDHRPLSGLRDAQASGSAETARRAPWRGHQTRTDTGRNGTG